MDSRYRRSEDQTLAGAGSAIKEASSFGTSIPSPLYAGGAPTGTGGTGAAVARAASTPPAIREPGTLLRGRKENISKLGLEGRGGAKKGTKREIEIDLTRKI